MSEPAADRAFVRGVLVGVAASAVLVHVWLAVELAPMRGMYGEFRAALPATTTLVISPYWLWGVPVAGALGVGALARRRPTGLVVHVLTAVALVLLAVATWRFASAPLRETASLVP